MAKGENAKKKGNRKEWWGKRPMAYCDSGRPGDKTNKRMLHKLERLEGKLEIRDGMSENEEDVSYITWVIENTDWVLDNEAFKL